MNSAQAAIRFDKFHAMRHLGEVLDKVRNISPRNRWGSTGCEGEPLSVILLDPENSRVILDGGGNC